MNGFCGVLSKEKKTIDLSAFVQSINLANTMKTETITSDLFLTCTSYLQSSPLKDQRTRTSDNLIFAFAGDLIGFEKIPWEEIETNFVASNFQWFLDLRGTFAFMIFNKVKNEITLISDHRAQLPIYYGIFDNNFVFSTDISTFTLLDNVPDFNAQWLYEFVYFNHPIDQTTFLKNVHRIRPITILNFDLTSYKITKKQYGERFKRSETLMTGPTALEKCVSTLEDRIPKYYSNSKINLVAISGGVDSRSVLALAPKDTEVVTYTYGVAGSNDLNIAKRLTKKNGIKHQEILFDKSFLDTLPKLIHDTVRLSGGTQPILRSSLSHVYKKLYNDNAEISTAIGGIFGDVFRGGGGIPSIVSYDMDHYLRTRKFLLDKEKFQKIFSNDWNDFENHMKGTFEKVEALYGGIDNGTTEVNFALYEIATKYFGGESAIASNYLTFRPPYFDLDIINLLYTNENSALGFSPYQNKKKDNSYRKYVMQTKVICTNPEFKNGYFRGLPIVVFARNNKLMYKASRFVIRGYFHLIQGYFRFIGKAKKTSPLEEWESWFKKILKKEFDKLLNDKSLILKYVSKNCIDSAKKTTDIHLLNKLATTEIILNLIKDKWQIES